MTFWHICNVTNFLPAWTFLLYFYVYFYCNYYMYIFRSATSSNKVLTYLLTYFTYLLTLLTYFTCLLTYLLYSLTYLLTYLTYLLTYFTYLLNLLTYLLWARVTLIRITFILSSERVIHKLLSTNKHTDWHEWVIQCRHKWLQNIWSDTAECIRMIITLSFQFDCNTFTLTLSNCF